MKSRIRIPTLIFAVALLTSLIAGAQGIPKKQPCPNPEDQAKYFLALEMAGWRLSSPNVECVRAVDAEVAGGFLGRSEAMTDPVVKLQEANSAKKIAADDLRITKIWEPVSLGSVGWTTRQVDFDVYRNGKPSGQRDAFTYIEFGADSKNMGCASLDVYPFKMYVRARCLNP